VIWARGPVLARTPVVRLGPSATSPSTTPPPRTAHRQSPEGCCEGPTTIARNCASFAVDTKGVAVPRKPRFAGCAQRPTLQLETPVQRLAGGADPRLARPPRHLARALFSHDRPTRTGPRTEALLTKDCRDRHSREILRWVCGSQLPSQGFRGRAPTLLSFPCVELAQPVFISDSGDFYPFLMNGRLNFGYSQLRLGALGLAARIRRPRAHGPVFEPF